MHGIVRLEQSLLRRLQSPQVQAWYMINTACIRSGTPLLERLAPCYCMTSAGPAGPKIITWYGGSHHYYNWSGASGTRSGWDHIYEVS